MTLIEFLTARYDEDEAAAQAVIDISSRGDWEAIPVAELDGRRALARGSLIFAVMDPVPEGRACADHAARHDPARVLREIAAKRKLLADYAEVADLDDGTDAWAFSGAYGQANGLGIAVRTIASVYADHPDYRQEWAL